MDRSQAASSNLFDNHSRLIADILTHYQELMRLATVQADDERMSATPESMAVTGISMKTEFDGLYSSVKELLTLSRRIKELWVFGPLGREDPDRRAKEAQIDADVAGVAALLEQMQGAGMKELAGTLGGAWGVAKGPEEATANGR